MAVFGEETMKRFFSRHWGLRDDALKVVSGELEKEESKLRLDNNKDELELATYGLIAFSLGDKIAQVAIQAFHLLEHMEENFGRLSLSEMRDYIDPILIALNDRVGDGNPRLREMAELALLKLCEDDADTIVSAVLRLASKKTINSLKHLSARAKLLTGILNRYSPMPKEIGEYAL